MHCTINSTDYVAVADINGCQGCVADNNPQLCEQLQQADGGYNYCAEHEVIWAEDLINPTDTNPTITTSRGALLIAQATTHCQGCAADQDRELCREIQHLAGPCYETPNRIWIKPQPVVPRYEEVLNILQEECAEVIQAISKVRRFGLQAHHPNRTATNKEELEEEVGDLLAMIEILTSTGYLDPKLVQAAKQQKTKKLEEYSLVWKA